MAKLIKLLLGFSILLVLLVVIVVTAAIMLFDPNQHKDFFEAQVKERTGRTLELAGNINMTFYPWLGLEVEKITMGNAEGFGEEDFLHADQIAMRIKTMPLLKKQYELDTLKLHGVKLNLVKDKQGKTNWEDLAGEAAEGEKEAVREIFENMGLNFSSAIKLFFRKTLQEGKVPFEISAKATNQPPQKNISKSLKDLIG